MHHFLKDGRLTVDFFDTIGGFWGGIRASELSEVLSENPSDDIRVRINSPGGSVVEGNAISHLLKTDSRPVHMEIVSLAASMAAGITTVGDEVSMSEDADFMIHNPWTLTWGDHRELQKDVDRLQSIKVRAVRSYVRRTGLSESEISDMMDAETWMDAETAKSKGFVDTIITPDSDADSEIVVMSILGNVGTKASDRCRRLIGQFRHAPNRISRYALRGDPKDDKLMPLTAAQILAQLGLKADASLDDVSSSVVPRADYQAQSEQLAEMQTSAANEVAAREATTKEQYDSRVKAAVALARSTGKISPSTVEYHEDTLIAGGSDSKALERFESTYGSSAPTVINTGDQFAGRKDGGTGTVSTPEDDHVKKMFGLTDEEYVKAANDVHSNPVDYPPQAYANVPRLVLPR